MKTMQKDKLKGMNIIANRCDRNHLLNSNISVIGLPIPHSAVHIPTLVDFFSHSQRSVWSKIKNTFDFSLRR